MPSSNYISILTSDSPGLTQDEPMAVVTYASDLQREPARAPSPSSAAARQARALASLQDGLG